MRAKHQSYGLKSDVRVTVLRVCGTIDVVVGLAFTAVAIGLWVAFVMTAAGHRHASDALAGAVICTVVGAIATWLGLAMMFNRVVVNETYLTSGQTLRVRRRVPRDQIIAIDIRQRNFGKAPRAMASAELRDGPGLDLMPLATPLTRSLVADQLRNQHAIVMDLRRTLNVEGTDLTETDVRWPGSRAGRG